MPSKSESPDEPGIAIRKDADTRKQRQADSLRQNLLKRKRQQRGRSAKRSEKTPDGS